MRILTKIILSMKMEVLLAFFEIVGSLVGKLLGEVVGILFSK